MMYAQTPTANLDTIPFWKRWTIPAAYPVRPKDMKRDDILAWSATGRELLAHYDFLLPVSVEHALWRWQFLRRREEYREAYASHQGMGVRASGRFGLRIGFPSPDVDDPEIHFDVDALASFLSPILHVKCDLRLGFEEQRKSIAEKFARDQKKLAERLPQLIVSNSSRRRWYESKLLRALDAERDDATPAEIGDIVARASDSSRYASAGSRLLNRAKDVQRKIAPIDANEPIDGFLPVEVPQDLIDLMAANGIIEN